MDKVILVVCDGLGDRPIKELNDKTPLEAANTKNLDKLATLGITGICDVLGVGKRPGSDTAHLAIFGYDPKLYYHGRGPFEAAGIGMDLQQGDVAFRCNLGTVDDSLKIIDRRAGRISSVAEFVKDLNMEIDGVKFFVKPGTAYRAGLVLRGRGLSHKVSDSDPHEINMKVLEVKPLDESKEAKFTASVMNKFLAKAHQILKEHPLNKVRIKEGKLPANFLLTRGAGFIAEIKKFQDRYGLKACCIAGAGLYKGIARVLGMDIIEVEGATGLPNTNIKAKIDKAIEVLNNYDFVFVHIKAADSLGEDGNYKEKKKFIEKIDKAITKLIGIDALVVITADHSTPCSLKKHSGDPVPILMCGEGVRKDNVKEFGERSCATGGLGRIKGLDIMPEIINLLGKAKLIGA